MDAELSQSVCRWVKLWTLAGLAYATGGGMLALGTATFLAWSLDINSLRTAQISCVDGTDWTFVARSGFGFDRVEFELDWSARSTGLQQNRTRATDLRLRVWLDGVLTSAGDSREIPTATPPTWCRFRAAMRDSEVGTYWAQDSVGVPFRCLTCTWRQTAFECVPVHGIPIERGEVLADCQALPLMPILGGTIGNAIVFGLLIGLLHQSARSLQCVCRRVRKRCAMCGYDLRAHVASPCPECGAIAARHD